MTAIQIKGAGRAEYHRLSSAKISKSKNIVVSKCSKGGFTIAQQLVVSDDQSEVSVFLKGAYHVRDVEALEAVRDALDEAIAKAHELDDAVNGEDAVNWDEE